MATLEDIVAATKVLSEDPETVMGGLGSKPRENGAGDSDMIEGDGGSAAGVGERVVETEMVVEAKTVVETKIVVESIGDEDESVVDNDLVVQDKEKIDIESAEPTVNGSSGQIIGVDESGKAFEDSSANNEQMKGDEIGSLDLEMEDMEGEEHGEKLENQDGMFRVGDFVWAKIKSHPWWPGQIYDPKDASEFAMKHKQEGRVLVAFFGDGSCSWCSPSQLKPFIENFLEISGNSSSKSFLNAVGKATDEIGRVLEYEMTKYIPHEKKGSLARPVVANAGIKEGISVPEVDVSRLSIPKYEPEELIEKVGKFGKEVFVDSVLELAILRSWVSAFYYYKGGYQLAVYHEPLYIEGLEDKNKTTNEVGDDFSVPIEVPILGPRDDDSLALSDDKFLHKRKQKSVAELMGESKNVKSKSQKRAKVKEGKDSEQKSLKRKRNNDGEDVEAKSRGDSSTGKIGKKRKGEVSESSKITKEKILKSENGVKKPKAIEIDADADAEDTSGEAKEESELVSTPRERKLSKYLSPPYTNLAWRIGNASFKTSQMREHKMESLDKESEEKLSNGGQVEDLNISDDGVPNKVKDGKKMTFPMSDVDVSISELLSEIRSAAVDPFYLSNEGTLDMVYAFVSARRSSTYLHGPDYKIFHKSKTERKRKSPEPHQENEYITPKQKSAETSGAKSSMEKTEAKVLPCLILEFTPEFPLPSKKRILKLFGKFGSLNARETSVMTDSHSIKVVYFKDSDAEAAFKSSVNKSPFDANSVNYKLHRSRKVSSSHKRAAEKRDSEAADDLVSDGRVIIQKFEIMSAILENYHSKFSSEDKSSLKDELKNLLEKVDTVSEKVRVLAENA